MASKVTTRLTGAAGAITAVGILAVAVVGNSEGLRLYVYKDVVGVYTYCYGETKGAFAKRGQKFTKAQCDLVFIGGLARHEKIMRSCLNDPDSLPDKTYVSFLSLTYNIGGGGFCKSSVARDANNLRLSQACNDLMKYVKAGGRTLHGLVTRRRQEQKLCFEGLREGKQ